MQFLNSVVLFQCQSGPAVLPAGPPWRGMRSENWVSNVLSYFTDVRQLLNFSKSYVEVTCNFYIQRICILIEIVTKFLPKIRKCCRYSISVSCSRQGIVLSIFVLKLRQAAFCTLDINRKTRTETDKKNTETYRKWTKQTEKNINGKKCLKNRQKPE